MAVLQASHLGCLDRAGCLSQLLGIRGHWSVPCSEQLDFSVGRTAREDQVADLSRITVARRTGSERFIAGDRDLGWSLLDFWQWSGSDLVANTSRGVVAEYLVGLALGCDMTLVRDPWAPFDLCFAAGGTTVEVKSAAYLQTWHQRRLSTISFMARATHAWEADSGSYASLAKRQADVYVFALLAHRDKASLNPMDASQWEFYVVGSTLLNERMRTRRTTGLSTVQRLAGAAVGYADLRAAVEAVVAK